jgi:putative phosphoesterase
MSLLLTIFSDTHGDTEKAAVVVRRVRPDIIVHLGDCVRDAEALRQKFPDIELHAVRGNNDFAARAPLTDFFPAGGKKLFLTHGHGPGVKHGLKKFTDAATEAGADIALFGHTHVPLCREEGGLLLLNPGACWGLPYATWARLEITDGRADCRIIEIK